MTYTVNTGKGWLLLSGPKNIAVKVEVCVASCVIDHKAVESHPT